MWIPYLYILSVSAAFALALFAAFSDLTRLTIPNWISISICTLYPIAVLTSSVEIDWILGLAVFSVVFVCGFLMFVLGWLGGGDVKLISALSLWAGFSGIFPFLLTTIIAGGILVPIIIFREVIRMSDLDGGFILKVMVALRGQLQIPYGVAISLGSLFIFFEYANNAQLFG